MALLMSCWFIIEAIIIPDGFLKWFYLSFYIHPIFLFLCQIFLWIKLIKSWCLFIVSVPIGILCFLASSIFRFLKNWAAFLFSATRLNHAAQVVEETNNFRIPQIHSQIQVVHLNNCLKTASILYELKIPEFQANGFEEDIANKEDSVLRVDQTIYTEEADLHRNEDISMEYLSFGSSSSSFTEDMDMSTADLSSVSSSNSPTRDVDMNLYLTSICSSNQPLIIERSVGAIEEDESDSFYKKYTERMRWFDVLNYDRTCGISAILNKKLGTPSSFEGIEPEDFSVPYISWSKMGRKRLLRSLESDFELVYVAQSCLSWEALHHQYRKVEALACSTCRNAVFYDNAAGKFQRFQVLLERFMEDERCEGKRYWNYVQKRFSLKSLIQVPQVSGYMEEEKEGMKGEAMMAVEVLKAIEECIKAFWLYVKKDKKKSRWNVRSFSLTCPPVEDPRDLKLLADLTNKFHKKELWLKDLQGKRKCWLKRVTNPVGEFGETQKKEMLFTMIDMKLVSRVLKMSMISTSQLKWCQEKLNKIEFKEGKVTRACESPSLFPAS